MQNVPPCFLQNDNMTVDTTYVIHYVPTTKYIDQLAN